MDLGSCDYCGKAVIDGDEAAEDDDVIIHAGCFEKWDAQ